MTLAPGGGPGSPVAWSTPDHQPRVPMAAGAPPYCTCGFVGGRGATFDGKPSLAEHGRAVGGML